MGSLWVPLRLSFGQLVTEKRTFMDALGDCMKHQPQECDGAGFDIRSSELKSRCGLVVRISNLGDLHIPHGFGPSYLFSVKEEVWL